MTDISISTALPEHRITIEELSDETHTHHRARLPHIFDEDNAYQHSLLDAALEPQLTDKSQFRGLIRVACREQELLGYVLVIWHAATSEDIKTTALIADIATVEGVRSQGVGKMLLEDIRAQMPQHGWDSLVADVWIGNTASHALFEHAGFDAERTEYRFGQPAPRKKPEETPQKTSQNFWWIAAAVLVTIALVASVP